jgi:CheY-like chemotaxis protein
MKQESYRVLVADDHADSAEILQTCLSYSGYEVDVAYTGQEAIDQAVALNPRSIILDLALPEINGYQVAETLRRNKQFTDTRIIAYSGYAGREYYERAQASGIDYYLLKPAATEVLLACLEPEKYADIFAEISVISESLDAQQRHLGLYSKVQALNLRSAAAVKYAQDAIRRSQWAVEQGRMAVEQGRMAVEKISKRMKANPPVNCSTK